jgi:hypothetical protein
MMSAGHGTRSGSGKRRKVRVALMSTLHRWGGAVALLQVGVGSASEGDGVAELAATKAQRCSCCLHCLLVTMTAMAT